MKLVTWNVNSVKARLERVMSFIDREQPDILCIQELKVSDDAFPHDEMEGAGYFHAVHGQKTYNGVAILSKLELADVAKGIPDGAEDDQARFVTANTAGIRVICVYVPNGKKVGTESYAYKLEWFKRLSSYLHRDMNPAEKIVLCGDLNVAPDDRDVANPEKWATSVLCHEDARNEFDSLRHWGLTDVFREHHPEGHVYSWWDYRMLGFPKGDGLRIDHILATQPLAGLCTGARVDRNERKGKLPSDHAPVIAEFDM